MYVKNYSTSIEQHCLFCYRVLRDDYEINRYGKKTFYNHGMPMNVNVMLVNSFNII